MARYWVADLHLGHKLVSGLRGFETTEQHDEAVLQQLNKLGPRDQLWILGDISSGRSDGEQRALELLKELRCEKHLIAGNHDSVSSIHRNGYRKQSGWLTVFQSIQQFGRVRINGRDAMMSHYPYVGRGDGPNRGVERYSEYRLVDHGLPLIHGHTHQSEKHMPNAHRVNFLSPEEQLDRRQFCVSWDVLRRPATEKDLNEWVDSLPVAW